MTLKGRVKNGVVKLENPRALANGTEVQVRPVRKRAATGVDCFAWRQHHEPFDPKQLEAMRAELTNEQYKALLAIARAGGPDVEAIRKFRAASTL